MQKRVIISLDSKTHEILKSVAQKSGRTLAFIIRDSINYTIENNIYHVEILKEQKLNRNFDFYLNEQDHNLLNTIAQTSNISLSSLIRQSVLTYLKVFYNIYYTNISKDISLSDYFELGDFKVLNNIDTSKKIMNNNSLEILVKMYIESGEIKKAKEVLNIIESKNPINSAYYHIAYSRIARLEKDISLSEIFAQKALEISFNNSNAGQSYYRLAIIAEAKGDSQLFSSYLDLSLSLLDYNKDWMLILQILCGKAYEAAQQNREIPYIEYMKAIKRILTLHPNYYFLAYARRIEAKSEFIRGNIDLANEKTLEGIEFAKKCTSVLSLFDQYEILGMLQILQNNNSLTLETLSKAKTYEEKFRPNSQTSLAGALIEIIRTVQSKNYYLTAKNNLIELTSLVKRQNVNASSYNFLLNYLIYNFGDQEEQYISQKELSNLVLSNKCPPEFRDATIALTQSQDLDLNLLVKACLI
jgi:predicted DNA-binding protein